MRIKLIQKLIDILRNKNQLRIDNKSKFQSKHVYIESPIYKKIYYPLYNTELKLESAKPEIYNFDGVPMDMFFLRDELFAHDPYNNPSKYFLWDRFNIGLKTHFYTHNSITEQMGTPDKKYGLFVEDRAIVPDDYEIFKKYKGIEKDFDAIFTFDEKLLNEISNAKFFPYQAKPFYIKEFPGGGVETVGFLNPN